MTDWAVADKDIEPTGWVNDNEPVESRWPPQGRARRRWLREAVQGREQITLVETEDEDLSVLPGVRATAEALKRQRTVRRLHRLIDKFATEGFGWSAESVCTIMPDTAKAAQRLLDLMSDTAELPKIAPDGDGGLTAVWERNGDHDLLVISGWTMHIVRNAATDRAEYDEDIHFDGQVLPESVKSLIST